MNTTNVIRIADLIRSELNYINSLDITPFEIRFMRHIVGTALSSYAEADNEPDIQADSMDADILCYALAKFMDLGHLAFYFMATDRALLLKPLPDSVYTAGYDKYEEMLYLISINDKQQIRKYTQFVSKQYEKLILSESSESS